MSEAVSRTGSDVGAHGSVLSRAAAAALQAPSILNTQPWRWQVHHGVLDLRADRERQLRVIDPQGRMLVVSCGVALHHLRVALAALGCDVEVSRLPDPADPDLLARIRILRTINADPRDMRHYQSILARHTDRRPFHTSPVPPATLKALVDAAESQHAHLQCLRPGQLPDLVAAAEQAANEQIANPGYLMELASWTHRPPGARDGVPEATVVPPVHRQVPLREFAIGGTGRLAPGSGDDRGASYAVLYTDNDDPPAWLRGGEALSAVLLAALEHGVLASPMSDLVEVPAARQTLRRLLGTGHPLAAVRIGLLDPATGVPRTPRRHPDDVIERDAAPR